MSSKHDVSFPVCVSGLQEMMPHRPPMIWVNAVLEVSENFGTCIVKLDPNAHYMDPKGQLRASSLIEWMAQSYGYMIACQGKMGLIQREIPKLTFVAQVRNAEFFGPRPDSGELLVHIEKIRELGPLILTKGRVETKDARLLAKAEFKLYAQ